MVKNSKIVPIILITLGIIFLLNNFGILPWSVWNNLWKFWPILLILFGLEYLAGHSLSLRNLFIILALIFLIPILVSVNPITSNPLETETLKISEPLGGLTKAKVSINLPATNLKIKAATASSEKAISGEVKFSKAAKKPKITKEASFGIGAFTISQDSNNVIPFINLAKNELNIELSRRIPFELIVTTQASIQELDFSDLSLDYLEINSQASKIKIAFSPLYPTHALLKAGASSIDIKLPDDTEARLKIDSRVKSVSLSERFKEEKGYYKTEGFDNSAKKIDLEIIGLANQINIR